LTFNQTKEGFHMRANALLRCLIAAALITALPGWAETVTGGQPILHAPFEDHAGALYAAAPGQAPMVFSFPLGFSYAVNNLGDVPTAVSPATLALVRGNYSVKAPPNIVLSSPTQVVGASMDANGQARLEGVTGVGGLSINAFADDLTNNGGSLTISRLFIDTQRHIVGGDVDGGNGVGFLESVALWSYDPQASNLSVSLQAPPVSSAGLPGQAAVAGQVSGLHLMPEAMAIFEQSLSLFPAGQAAFEKINTSSAGWGVLTVPEPASAALMGLGLSALMVVRRRP
jgi:hypothetical protein